MNDTEAPISEAPAEPNDESLVFTSVRIGTDQHAALTEIARERRTSKAALIRASIDLFLAANIDANDIERADPAA